MSYDETAITGVALLDEPTRRRLYDLVATSGDAVGRDDAAEATGISRELAAFHLDRLAAAGLLQVEFRRRTGRAGPGAGRPAKLYRPSGVDVAVSLPRREYETAATMLSDAMALLDADSTRSVLEEVARTAGLRAGAEACGATEIPSPNGRGLSDLVDVLDDAGFGPRVDPGAGVVTLRNCPYRSLAMRHRDIICGMNLAWAGGVVSALGVADVEVRLRPEPGRCCVVFDGGASPPGAVQPSAEDDASR